VLSYIITLNDRAPWLAKELDVETWLTASGVQDAKARVVYDLGAFRGFAGYFSQVQVEQIRALDGVKYVEEDGVVEILPVADGVNDSSAVPAGDWGQNRVDQRCLPLNKDFNPCANPVIDCTGSQATIWIIDTGVRYTHSEFAGRAELAANFATGDPSPWNGDCNGHGTHCAGSAAGKTYGIATAAKIKSVRVLSCGGSGAWSDVIQGLQFVANNQVKDNRNLASLSLGGGYNQAVNDAIEDCIAKGVIVLVAAGNNNDNACNYSPASAPKVITVGSTTTDDSRSSFSNWGKCVDVFAPGTNILSSWYLSDTATNTISGTSMATPLAAGSIALMPGFPTHDKVISDFIQTCTLDVVKNPGTDSPNRLIYDRHDDGTGQFCIF